MERSENADRVKFNYQIPETVKTRIAYAFCRLACNVNRLFVASFPETSE